MTKQRQDYAYQLTAKDVRMVGVPTKLHEKIKQLAQKDGIAMYAVVALGVELYEAHTTDEQEQQA